jgi:hypothetical protein
MHTAFTYLGPLELHDDVWCKKFAWRMSVVEKVGPKKFNAGGNAPRTARALNAAAVVPSETSAFVSLRNARSATRALYIH